MPDFLRIVMNATDAYEPARHGRLGGPKRSPRKASTTAQTPAYALWYACASAAAGSLGTAGGLNVWLKNSMSARPEQTKRGSHQ